MEALTLWLVIAGIAMMIGGKKAFGSVLRTPFEWGGKLLGDGLKAVVKLAFDLLGGLVRGTFRLLDRGARHVLRLPPPSRPQRRPRNQRRRASDDDCDDED